jgi:HPt (histidine-containing phosphotransfer) domain-containing protein
VAQNCGLNGGKMGALKKQKELQYYVVIVNPRFEKILDHFVTEQKQNVQILRDACGKLDHETLIFLGHKMKGSCGTFGFHDLSRLGAEIEISAEAKDFESVNYNIRLMEEFLLNMRITWG